MTEVIDIICPQNDNNNSSRSGEQDVESRIFDLLGEDGLELLISIMPQVSLLKSLGRSVLDDLLREMNLSGELLSDETSYYYDDDHGLSVNQKKKREKKLKKQQEQQQEVISVDQYDKYVNVDPLVSAGFHEDYLEQERLLGLQGGSVNNSRAHTSTWMDNLYKEGTLQHHDVNKKSLPPGTTRKTSPGVEIVKVPASKKVKMNEDELIPVTRLEDWAQLVFPTMKRYSFVVKRVCELLA